MEFDTSILEKLKIHEVDHVKYFLNPSDRYISEDLLRGYVWEEHVKNTFDTFVNKDDVVVDVGANIGIHTISLSRFAKEVYSFEPVPLLFAQLLLNCTMNNCYNVKLYQMGLNSTEKSMFVPSADLDTKINWGNTRLSEEKITPIYL